MKSPRGQSGVKKLGARWVARDAQLLRKEFNLRKPKSQQGAAKRPASRAAQSKPSRKTASSPATFKFPLLVQLEYHPDSTEAAGVAEYLYSALKDDPVVPGLRIPTCFVPDDGTPAPPEPQIASEADRVLVVLLSDDHLAAHARDATDGAISWGDYVVRLRQLCEASSADRFMPVQLTEHGWPIDQRLDDLNFLPAWTFKDAEEQRKYIARRLVHLMLRRLRPHKDNEDAPALTIFVSHTKLDIEHEPRVVQSLLAQLTATQPEKTWFDSGDIATGSRFAKEIERGVEDAALLAVVTDSYSSRSWCRREVLLAKRYQRPVVVVDGARARGPELSLCGQPAGYPLEGTASRCA